MLSGLWSKSAEPPEGTTGSDHWVAAAYLTGIKPRKTAGSDATVGSPTIDQMIAMKIGQETLLPSLQLAVEDPNSSSSNCGEGYSCSYTNSISWIDLPTPANEPIAAHEPAADGAQSAGRLRAAVRQRRDAGSARRAHAAEPQHPRFGARRAGRPAEGSRRRAIGAPSASTPTRSARSSAASSWRRRRRATVPVMDLPPGIPEQFDDHIKLHFDLTALAFQADITRVATLLGARDLTGRSYPFPKSELFPNGGVSVGFHGGSHHQDDPAQIKRYADLNRYHVSTLGVLRREAAVDSGRRRHAARSLADSVRHEHGQLESAPALRRAAHPRRRRQRPAQRQPPSRVRAQDRDDRQPAAERPRHVRHPQGQAGRQHGPAGEARMER